MEEATLTTDQRIQVLQAIAPALQRSSGLEFFVFFESTCRAMTMPLDELRLKINKNCEQANQPKSNPSASEGLEGKSSLATSS